MRIDLRCGQIGLHEPLLAHCKNTINEHCRKQRMVVAAVKTFDTHYYVYRIPTETLKKLYSAS